MKARQGLTRRSFLGRIAAGTMVGGSALMIGGEARAFQYSDKDQGPLRDRVGHGRTRPRTMIGGDQDSGAYADPGGAPRPTIRFSGATDTDSGPAADPQGYSRRWRGRIELEERERLMERRERPRVLPRPNRVRPPE
jgi:hypothetical protein